MELNTWQVCMMVCFALSHAKLEETVNPISTPTITANNIKEHIDNTGTPVHAFHNIQEFIKQNNMENLVLPVDAPVPMQLPLPNGVAPPSLINLPNLNIQKYLQNLDIKNVPAPSFLQLDKIEKLQNVIPLNMLPNILNPQGLPALPIEAKEQMKLPNMPLPGFFPLPGPPDAQSMANLMKLIPFPKIIGKFLGNLFPQQSVGSVDVSVNQNMASAGGLTSGLFPLGQFPRLMPFGDDKTFEHFRELLQKRIEELEKKRSEEMEKFKSDGALETAQETDEDATPEDNADNTTPEANVDDDASPSEAAQGSGPIDMTNVWNINLTPDMPSEFLSPIVSSIISSMPIFQTAQPLDFQQVNIPFAGFPNFFDLINANLQNQATMGQEPESNVADEDVATLDEADIGITTDNVNEAEENEADDNLVDEVQTDVEGDNSPDEEVSDDTDNTEGAEEPEESNDDTEHQEEDENVESSDADDEHDQTEGNLDNTENEDEPMDAANDDEESKIDHDDEESQIDGDDEESEIDENDEELDVTEDDYNEDNEEDDEAQGEDDGEEDDSQHSELWATLLEKRRSMILDQ